eukprot:jgi/Chlat1/1992/Chrsp158S02294
MEQPTPPAPAQVSLMPPPPSLPPSGAAPEAGGAAGRGGAGDGANQQTQNAARAQPVAAAPKVREKVPYQQGFSQMDWLRVTKTRPNLNGLNGQPLRRVTMEEVKRHKSPDDAWMVLRGKVYNISPYLSFHPGGRDKLMLGAGRDGTTLFNKYHAWVNADFLMEKTLVGVLVDTPADPPR